MGFPDLVFRQARISRQQERLDLVSPQQIHDFLVRENGVRGQTAAAHVHDDKKRRSTGGKQSQADHQDTRCWPGLHGSDAAQNQENHNSEKDHSHSSGWVITPVTTMRPSWQRP